MADEQSRRWTDERLDDAFHRVDARLRSWEDANVEFAVLTADVHHMREAQSVCMTGIADLKKAMAEKEKAEDDAEERRIERARQDLKYIISTVVAVGGLIVAALAILGVGG